MRGVILSGGLGTRLAPITNLVNKHLLPVYDKLMGEYPLETLVKAGITDIMIVTGEKNAGTYVNYFKDGSNWGAKIVYGFQKDGNGGIAEALAVAREFCNGHKVATLLGDNYFEDDVSSYISDFDKQERGAMIFLKEVNNPRRYGVARIDGDKIIEIVEKPINPQSNLAQTGLYLYDERVFDFIKQLKPSERNELEITDLNNIYIKEDAIRYVILKGAWFDMGTFDSLLDAANFIRNKKQQNQL